MISLDIKVETEKIVIDNKLKLSFKDPLVFYLLNKEALYLCSFVILDFQNEEIKYVETLSEENKRKVEKEYGAGILMDPPHSIMGINKNKFLNMVYSVMSGVNNTFRIIDLEKNEMAIYTAEDFGYRGLGRVSETGTKDIEDKQVFYICFIKEDGSSTEYFKFSIDLQKSEHLFNDNGIFKNIPHQIARCGDFIFSSGFWEEEGKVLTYNIKNKKIDTIPLINPSHFEVLDNIVYYSSNNVKIENLAITFLGPARIGKIYIEGDKIRKGKEFSTPSGFRYTSHKCLSPEVLVTFGFPNRLIFINSESMELLFYYDVDEKILPDTDVQDFLNNEYDRPGNDNCRYSALECSDDQKYVVFFNQKVIRFFNFADRKIEYEIKYKIKDLFFQFSHHCDLLR